MPSIPSIGPVQGAPESLQPNLRPQRAAGTNFSSVLNQAVEQVEGSLDQAANKVDRLLNGKPEELHSVVLATQRAGLEMELFLEVRNKVVEAYQEVMRMQI